MQQIFFSIFASRFLFNIMATYRELTYLILDEIKAISDDSTITQEHVLFTLNHYRNYIIQQKIKADGESSLNQSNSQTICVDLERTSLIPEDNVCSDVVLKSIQKVPDMVNGTNINVFPINYFANTNMCMVSKDRFKFVGNNKYMRNIIYTTLGEDNYIYCKSTNPQFQYLNKIKVSGIFDDAQKAGELSCDNSGASCDVMDTDFPLESSLIPTLVDAVVKQLSAVMWRQQDNVNDANDDLADLIAYLAKNTKSELAKQLVS